MGPWVLLALVAAPEAVRQPIDRFESVEAWAVNRDGSEDLTFRHDRELCVSPPGALHITFGAGGKNVWGNLARAVTVPPDATAVAFRLHLLRTAPSAVMTMWLLEADGDGWLASVTVDGQPVSAAPKGVWHDVVVPLGRFAHQPRGNGQRQFLTARTLLLGCNAAAVEAVVDDLEFVVDPGAAAQPLPRSATWAPTAGRRGSVALVTEPTLWTGAGRTDPARLTAALTAAGYGVTAVRAGDLADRDRLTTATFDLLVLPGAPEFPAAARANLLAWLRGGGAVLSVGGYAFDTLVDWNGEAWVELGAETRARDLDRGRPDEAINTRRGKPGDTMAYPEGRIGLFDPQDTFSLVAATRWGDRRVAGSLAGYVGRSLAGGNSPVFPAQYGETVPIGETVDRLGRPRGALGVVCQLFAGPYAGAAWGGFGVTDRDLFTPEALGSGPLVEAVDRLVGGLFLHSLAAEPVCVREGEPVTVTVQVRNRSRVARTATVELAIEGVAARHREIVTVAPGATQPVRLTWSPGRFAADLYRVEAHLSGADLPAMALETGFSAWQPDLVARGPRATWRDNYLALDGRARFETGTNQTGQMWFSPREHPLVWDRDFQTMRDHGCAIWRILHFSTHATGPDGTRPERDLRLLNQPPPDRLVRQTDAIVQLAQKHRQVIFLCAHDWMGTALTDAELAAQQTWNRFWAARYKDVPGLIWDIQNEPSVTLPEPLAADLQTLWQRFVGERCGGAAAAREALGGGAALPPPLAKPADAAWGSYHAALSEQFRTVVLQRWVAANVQGLRDGDPDAVVTVGYLQSRPPADKVNGARGLDFSNMHSYDPARQFAASLRWIDRRAHGQGLSLGEFGSRSSHDHRVNGGTGEQVAADRARFATTLALTLGSGGSFALNWFWRDLPDVVFPWGLLRQDRVPRPWMAEVDAINLVTRFVEPRSVPPALYLLLPDEHRLGPRFGELDRALHQAIDATTRLGLDCGVLNEHDLASLPAAAKAILWPLPYCPSDATFATVRRWVEGGGRLLVTGHTAFDEQRRPTRTARWQVAGLDEPQPTDPFATVARAEAVTAAVGAGQVTRVPWPVELAEPAALLDLYTRFVDAAGLPRRRVMPADAEIQTGEVHEATGRRLLVVANWGATRRVGLTGEPAVELTIGADRAGLALLSAAGAPVAVLADGATTIAGQPVSDGAGLVLDPAGGDLRQARAVVALPLATGTLRWRGALPAAVAVAGEVRDGRWRELGRERVTTADGWTSLVIDEALVGTLVVVGEPAAAAATITEVVRALTGGAG